MNRHFNLPRSLRRTKSTAVERQPHHVSDTSDLKAQHILGLSNEDMKIARNDSLSSTSASQVQSVSFSEATTVPVVTIESADGGKHLVPSLPELNLKLSSVPLRDDNALATPVSTKTSSSSKKLRKASSSSLRSYYNKQDTPLSISQQTSASSTRDFALRRGTPSVVSSKSQETEHTRQLRLFATQQDHNKTLLKKPSPTSPTAPSRQDGQHLPVLPPSTSEDALLQISTEISAVSLGNRSAGSGHSKDSQTSLTSGKPPPKTRETTTFRLSKPVFQHDRFKVHVRRPKVGTKHWFDDIDEDSSEEENINEPELNEEFVRGVEEAFQTGKIGPTENRRLSRQSQDGYAVSGRKELRQVQAAASDVHELDASQYLRSIDQSYNVRPNPLQRVDLSQHSVLNLSSSDDEGGEESDEPRSTISGNSTDRQIRLRESLSPYDVDESDVDVGVATAISSQTVPLPYQPPSSHRLMDKLTVPRRNSSKLGTYFNDRSSENVQPDDDIITSFPAAPVESSTTGIAAQRTSVIYEEPHELPELHEECMPSQDQSRRISSLSHRAPTTIHSTIDSEEQYFAANRYSIQSDNLSSSGTRVMKVTKQEESLIAAMRLKRAAMKHRAVSTNRQDALKILEYGGPDLQAGHVRRRSSSSGKRSSYARQKQRESGRWSSHRRSMSGDLSYRPDSTTTFQTSIADRSTNQSRATYATETSDDLQLPYSTFSGSMAAMIPNSLRRNESRQTSDRSTFYSTTSDGSLGHRDSHVVMLDPLDRQLLREEIPSQLFMERPFLGWEARANLQPAR